MTRWAATFTPSIVNKDCWWTRILHSTKFRARMMSAFWSAMDAGACKEANFKARESLQGFEKPKSYSP